MDDETRQPDEPETELAEPKETAKERRKRRKKERPYDHVPYVPPIDAEFRRIVGA